MKHKKDTRLPVERIEAAPEQGLTAQQAAHRLKTGWGNDAGRQTGRTGWQILRSSLFTYFNLVFVIMAALMVAVGSSILNFTFMVVVFFNTAIGCIQQLRAKRAVDKLSFMAEQTLPVIRDGETHFLPSRQLVLDDLVVFTAGDQICADGVVCTGQVQVNEALVTGEEEPIAKAPGGNLLSGSFVVSGRCVARLTAVGKDAYAARLAAEAKKDPKVAKSEVMTSLDKLIKGIGILLIPVGGLLFYSQFQTNDLQNSVEATVAALVGMIPEGLYLLTSVALALSALKLTKKRVLVQDMNCIEALARTDTLCLDKTGTITAPQMDVALLIPLSEIPVEQVERALGALFAQDADNETARAIAARFPAKDDWVCTGRIGFASEHKWSGAAFENHGTFLVGAPEVLLGRRYEQIKDQVDTQIQAGYRVLLLASYDGALCDCPEPDKIQPLALLPLSNRLRQGAQETFSYFVQQGVTVKVISGDHPVTAAQVAARAGIPGADRYVDAATLDTPEKLAQAAIRYNVFGRVTPEQKKLLVRSLQEAGHTVAMTGDGVNDVLAMKEAACSVAIAGGAQAANQAARLVLLDGDFSVMPRIVDEGRRVINNIRRAASLFLVKNIFSIGLALLTLVTGLRFPLESFHMSIVSSLTIGVPGFLLALEPNYRRVRGRFLVDAIRGALPGGLTNILAVLTAQALMAGLHLPETDGQTITTAILCCVGLMVLYRVCCPFTKLRRFVWIAMTVCVVGAFFVLPPLIGYLRITKSSSYLVLAAMLALAAALFLVMNRLMDWIDKLKKKTYT